jgi:membrane-associated phospholipid phosphatase
MNKAFRVPLLAVSAVAAVLAIGLTWLVYTHPFMAFDATIERDVQAADFGPLATGFGFFTAIGGPMGLVGEAVVFVLVLLLNRSAWRLPIAGALASGWYFLLAAVIFRPRPSVPDVLRVTEHPGASSYPSGHMIIFVFYAAVLMLCIGYRYLPRRWIPYGWGAAAVLVAIGAISRMYSGAHWPTDVLAGALIAVAWLSFVVSVRWISNPVLVWQSRGGSAVPAGRPLSA